MQKGKPKMPIKKRIVAAAMAVFVGATSFNVSIPGFSSVVLTDADETEGIREEEESTQAANEVQAQLSNDEMPVVEETESLKQPETVAQTTLEETTTAESTVQPEPTEEAALEETSLAEEEQQPQTSTEEIEQSSEVAKEQQEQTSQEEEQTANDEIALFANEDDSNDAPAVNPIPSLDDYITSAKISEKHGDTWDPVNKIISGTNVRVDLDYSIPAGVITKDARKMQYQLPKGIKIQKEETGTLKDQNKQPIGTFTIDQNGLVIFEFNEDFSDEKAFTGDFYFECQVDSNKSQEDVTFVFPGKGTTNFTIKPSDDAFDIKAQKTASELIQGDDGEWYANYTITVSSQRGTSGDVEIIDQLQNNSSSAPYRQTIDMSSIVVKDKDGNVVDPSSFKIIPSKDNLGFTTTLPKLKAGESYTITCKALVNKNLLGTNSDNDIYLNANQITAKSGNNSSSAQTSVKYKRNAIEKTVTKQDGSYFYTVTVNKDKANLKGLTLKDKFTYDNKLIDVNDIQDFTVTSESDNPGITKENFFNGGFTFDKDFMDTIVITYKYTPPANESNSDKQLNNRADIGTNAWAETKDTVGKIGYLKKNYGTGTVEANGKYLDIPYTITLKMPSGGSIQNGATLTDELRYDAQNSPQTLLTEVTVNGINPSDYTITYYDKDGKEVGEFKKDTITKFVITFNREITFEKAMDLTFTYTVKGGIDYDSGNREFRNTAMFKSGSIDQSVTKTYVYIKNKFLLKKVSRYNSGYNTDIGTVKESELTDDKLYYEIEVKPKEAGLDNTFEITDELPEGTSFVEGSYDVKTGGNDVTKYVEMTQSGNTLTFSVGKDAFNGEVKADTLYIHYALKVSRTDPSGAESEIREFTNTVKSNGSEESVTVPVFFEEKVIKDEDVLEKTGSQKNDTDITYTVVVNKNKLDLIPNSDSITLTDILNCDINESKIQDITLVGNKVYVYEYDATQKDGKGAPVSNNFYTYTYDSKTHHIQLGLSDSTAYVVEYTYRFKFTSDFAGESVTIKNDVALAGSYKKEISTEWKKQSAGGSVKKHNSLLVYKVEKGNEDVKLSGAKFDLYKYEHGEFVLVQNDIEVSDIGRKFVSDQTDPTTMATGDIAVSENTLYRLTETKAPDGYQIDSDSEHFYFVVGKYGMSLQNLKEAVKESVEGAKISSSDVHFASTNAIANITNQIAEGAVRIQKVWQNSDGSEMQASQSEISVDLYQTTRQYQDTDPEVTIEVGYINKSGNYTYVSSQTEHYVKGSSLTVTAYINNGWRLYWEPIENVGMNAKVYLNGTDTEIPVDINKNGLYRATYTTTVDSSLNKIRLVVQANSYNDILDGSRPSKITGTQASMLNGEATLIKSVTLSRVNNWTAIVEGLPLKDDNGNDFYYYVDEEDVPYSYSVSYTNNGVLAGVAGNPITVVNKADEEVKTASFEIHKVDAKTNNSLSDAIFALYRAKQNDQGQWVKVGQAVAALTSDTNGICGPFSGLIPGEYLLYETSAPFGYATPSDPWRITVNNDCTIDAHGLKAADDGAYVIENSKHPGMISITKKVVGEEIETGLVYYLKVTLTDSNDKPLTGTYGGQTLDENGSAIYEVRKDGTVLLSGIPLGTKYTVEEVDSEGNPLTGNEGYISSISNSSGTIATGSTTATVTVTNTYAKAEATAKINVGKLIEISDGSEFNPEEEFEFTLTGKDNAPMPTSATVKVKAGAVGSFGEIKYEKAGTYTYTVRETAGTTVGMVYDTTGQEITVRVSEDEPGKLEAVVIYPKEGATAAFVTNKFGLVTVSGTKTWRAPEGTTHPDSITVLLKRNGETINSKTVTAKDNWRYSWENLPKYSENGKTAYTYTVDEEEVDGYIKKVTGYDITNTITGTTSVEGTKIWKAPDGIELPESITVILYQNGEEYDTKVVTADDNWTYSWEKLPKYSKNGETEYTYTVDEEEVAGYTKKVEGYDLINTITGITSVEGTKTWRVPEGIELPESITVNLYQDGIQIDSKAVTAKDNWTYKFANLPKYDADGKEYKYTIDEEPVAGYNKEINGYNLTNTRSEKIEISGEKTWNVPEGTELPESITVNLYQDGTKIASKTVTKDDNWTYKFEDLPAFTENADKAYVYTVEEEPVEGYITTINGYNITNTITGTTSVSGEKTWKVPEGTTHPDSITVLLKRNGETIASKTVTAKDNWRYSWENLPKYSKNGKTAYTYTVDEEEVDGYIKKVTGYDITNTITGTTSVEGTKIWKAPAGIKLPESITVILYQNGEEYDTKVVTADDNWKYSWEELPMYSENGETEYTYTVDEEEVAGYTKKVEGYDLINTITGTLSVSGEKTWNVPEGIELPESITVILNRDGIKIDSKTVTAKDNWTYKFANLPKYDADGMYYDYTIDEEPVAGYNKEINGYNLTNTKSEMIEVSGEKIWKVPEGTTLPESITVILNQNGTEYARTTVTAADNWTYKFENLPGYSEDGKTAYLYIVEEVPVEGYATTVSGYNIINTLTGTTSVSGEKTWNVPEGTTLPESITVLLKRNGEIVDSKTVTAEDNWAYAWEELPAYSEDGKTEYVYTVDEEEVAGYTKRVDGYNIINTLTGTTSVSGEKTWNVPEGTTLPDSITVILKQNGTEYARTTVTAADNWIYKFENLPTYSKDGKTAYTYTVEEVPVEGYITTIDGFDITNTITSVKISKVDIADGKELEGAHIQIIDKETGEVIEEWDSTKEAHEVTGLVPGKTYILRETVAPDGYDITSDTTFVLKEDGTVDTDHTTTTVKDGVLLVEDSRQIQIQINFVVNKVSATDDHELFDTILSVYEVTENGEVLVDSWTSRWKEVHNFGSKLSCGKTYILREDKATGGYHKIPDDIRFTVTVDGKIQITQGQDWIYENGKKVIERVTDASGDEIYLIRDVRNPAEEEETEPDGPTDPHQSQTTAPDETTSTPEEETSTTPEETTPEESTTRTPDEEESTPEFTNPAINTTTTADETTVSETPVNETPASSRSVILGIEDMSRTLGMALVGFGAIMLAALIWLYLRSKKA